MNNFYLFYGSDYSLINREIEILEDKLKINKDDITYYSIESINEIIEEALTISMFSLNKFIVIDATSYLSDKLSIDNINLLEDYFEKYNKNAYLVFYSKKDTIDSRKKLVKLISKNGIVQKKEPTSDYIYKYIDDYIKENGYNILKEDISYFQTRVGSNVDLIKNELDKIFLYKIEDKNILRSDIDRLTDEDIDESIFDLASLILKKNSKKALLIYRQFLINGMEPISLVPILASQVRLLFQVKRLYNKGKTNDEIASILGFKSVYRVKYILRDAYYYSEEDLIENLKQLALIDEKIKLGLADGNILMELYIAGKGI